METRKIIKFGTSSHVITLPNAWLLKNNLKKGDEINLSVGDNNLIFSLMKNEEYKKAIINIDDKPLKLFNRELISYYLKNYKFIEIRGKTILDKIDQIKVFQEKLSSVEIVEINEDNITLKDLTSPTELNFNNILNEIIEMEKMLFTHVIKNYDDDKKFHKQNFITQIDSNINKLTFLAYKAINYSLDIISDPILIKSSIHNWRIISALEQIGDIIKRIARYLKNSDKILVSNFNQIFLQIQSYFEFITLLINSDVNLDNNLKLYMDKKQSLLREFEKLKDNLKDNLNLYFVINQLFKDILGQLDVVILSVTDINTK